MLTFCAFLHGVLSPALPFDAFLHGVLSTAIHFYAFLHGVLRAIVISYAFLRIKLGPAQPAQAKLDRPTATKQRKMHTKS